MFSSRLSLAGLPRWEESPVGWEMVPLHGHLPVPQHPESRPCAAPAALGTLLLALASPGDTEALAMVMWGHLIFWEYPQIELSSWILALSWSLR